MSADKDWDDLFAGHEEILPPANIEDDDDIDSRVVGDDDDALEASAGKKPDDDDDIIPPANPSPRDEDDKKEPEPPVSDQSGIELYLSQFDIEGGIINFEDGSSKHFNELDATQQAEVLQGLHGAQATAIEDKYGLDEDEIGLLNYLRENEMSVEELIESEVNARIDQMMSMQELASEDYANMDADAIYAKWLQENNPEYTSDQIAADLAKAKELGNFTKITDTLKSQFIQRQTVALTEAERASQQEFIDMIEQQRKEIVETVMPMQEIAGITLDQNLKNSVLDQILQVNDEGDSIFMDTVFAEPESLFKAAFWYMYGEAIVAQRDEYWKKEKSAAYKRGKEDALGVTQPQSQGRSFTSKPAPGKQEPHTARPAGRKQEPVDGDDWSDLHTS